MLKQIEKGFYKVCAAVSVVILLSITVFALMQVAGRYIFHHTFFWVEEITAIELGWLVAMGAPMMWLKNEHIRMDAIDRLLSPRMAAIWDCVIHAAAIAIGIVFAVAGMKAYRFNSGYSISLLRYDESVRYIFVPVMGALLSLAAALKLIENIQRIRKEAGNDGP